MNPFESIESIPDQLKQTLGDKWADLDETVRGELEKAAEITQEAIDARLAGAHEAAAAAEAVLRSVVLDWTWDGGSEAVALLVELLKGAAVLVGRALVGGAVDALTQAIKDAD